MIKDTVMYPSMILKKGAGKERIDKLTTDKVTKPHFIDDLPSVHQKIPIFSFCVVLEV